MIAPTNAPPRSPLPESWLHAPRIVWKHRRRAGLFFLGTMLLVSAWLVLWPREYLSEAKLFVRVGRESVTLDPTATTGQTISVYDSREVEINSVLELLGSRVLLERVVEDVGAQTILADRRTGGGGITDAGEGVRSLFPATVDDESTRLTEKDSRSRAATAKDVERAVRKLEKSIEAARGRKSSVISISCTAGSPELARTILKSYLAAFHALYLKANRTSGSHEFFARQAELLQEKLTAAIDELSRAKNEIGLASVEGGRAGLQDQINTIESRIHELEIRERELLAKYTEHHPLVQTVREQIDEARGILAGQHDDSIRSPAFPKSRASAANTFALNERLRRLNEREGLIARLEQRVAVLRAEHQDYVTKREQARINQELAETRISNVNVVQQPTVSPQPVSPKKRLGLILGFIVAALGGVGVAFLCEYASTPAGRGAAFDGTEPAGHRRAPGSNGHSRGKVFQGEEYGVEKSQALVGEAVR